MSKSILLVEDDASDARLIQRAFSKIDLGDEIWRLTNGDEAVQFIRGDGPYENRALYPLPLLMLLDIKLPRRSGLEVLTFIRAQHDAVRRMPIVMLTSSRHFRDVNQAYDLGANSYLCKPDTAQQLTELASTVKNYWLHWNEQPSVGPS